MKLVSSIDTDFGWPERRLDGVAARIFVGLGNARLRSEGGEHRVLPLLNVRDLRDGRVPPASALEARTVAAGAEVDRYVVQEHDVVITCRGTQLRVASIPPSTAGALISANLIAVRTGPQLLPAVLLVLLQSEAGQRALLLRGQSSTSNLLLTPKAIGEVSIPVPPLEVQEQIAALVSTAEQHHVAAVRAADQRRAVAFAVAVDLLRGQSRQR